MGATLTNLGKSWCVGQASRLIGSNHYDHLFSVRNVHVYWIKHQYVLAQPLILHASTLQPPVFLLNHHHPAKKHHQITRNLHLNQPVLYTFKLIYTYLTYWCVGNGWVAGWVAGMMNLHIITSEHLDHSLKFLALNKPGRWAWWLGSSLQKLPKRLAAVWRTWQPQLGRIKVIICMYIYIYILWYVYRYRYRCHDCMLDYILYMYIYIYMLKLYAFTVV